MEVTNENYFINKTQSEQQESNNETSCVYPLDLNNITKNKLLKALKILDKGVKHIKPAFSNNKVRNLQKLCFQCSHGHYFLLGSNNTLKNKIGCPICFVEYTAKKKDIDIIVSKCGVYLNQCTTMYIHCNECQTNFYASMAQILSVKYLLDCISGHMSLKNPVIKTRRIFEIFFEKPFVDSIIKPDDVIISNDDICQVTGYDTELNIAFIHLTDTGISGAEKCQRVCSSKKIALVVIPKSNVGGGTIAWSIFEQLDKLGTITDNRLESLITRAQNSIIMANYDIIKKAVLLTRNIMRTQDTLTPNWSPTEIISE